MKNKEIDNNITIEQALEDPAYARFHDAIRLFRNTPASTLFPKKHEMGLTYLVERKTVILFEENPKMPIKSVITTVFEPLTDDIPAPLLLKLTKKIIAKWTKLQGQSLQENRMAAVAA